MRAMFEHVLHIPLPSQDQPPVGAEVPVEAPSEPIAKPEEPSVQPSE